MDPIRFDNRVAVVTGAGSGLGRAHALALAARGAKVVVNDPGTDVSGGGGDHGPADRVVAEIGAAGGLAVPSYLSVAGHESAQRIIQTAIDEFGRIDVLVNNAGILRDRTLAKMDPADFDLVVRVHLGGSAYCTRAALPFMQAQGYGRIVLTTSAAGLYGNFGQTNYAAAKLGLVGLMNALKHECERYAIRVNTIAPIAVTRMTEGLPFADLIETATPDKVSAGVLFLASEACDFSGAVLVAGGGYFARAFIVVTAGVRAAPEQAVTPEFVAGQWAALSELRGARPFDSAMASLAAEFGSGRPDGDTGVGA